MAAASGDYRNAVNFLVAGWSEANGKLALHHVEQQRVNWKREIFR